MECDIGNYHNWQKKFILYMKSHGSNYVNSKYTINISYESKYYSEIYRILSIGLNQLMVILTLPKPWNSPAKSSMDIKFVIYKYAILDIIHVLSF